MLARLRAALPILATLFMFAFAGYMAFAGADARRPPFGQGVRGGDLVAFWAGGTVLAQGDHANLYRPKRLLPILAELSPKKRKIGYPAGYPPPIYQLFALPQPSASYFDVARVLLFGLVACQVAVAAVLARTAPALRRPEAIAALIAAPALFTTLGSGQLGAFWTLALVVGLIVAPGAGLVLGLLWIKPTLAVPAITALALLGRWRKVAEMVGGGALVLAASLAAGGGPAWEGFVRYLGDPGRIHAVFLGHWDREITLRALVVWPFRGEAADVADAIAVAVGWIVLLGAAWVARPVRSEPIATAAVFAISYGSALHLLDYDAGLLIPAFVAAALWLPRARQPRVGVALTILAWGLAVFVPVTPIVGVHVPALVLWAWIAWLLAELHGAARERRASS